MTNQELMQRVHLCYGPTLGGFPGAISEAVKASAIPPPFVAALIANESGGDPHVKRFEKTVLGEIWEVLIGRKPAFGPIQRDSLIGYVAQVINSDGNAIFPMSCLQRIDSLCTSHGLTQIMGYHILESDMPIAADTEILATPPVTLQFTVALLEQFAKRFGLDERKDFEQLFRCWNAGHPTGETFDPNYVPNGLTRMKLYEALA